MTSGLITAAFAAMMTISLGTAVVIGGKEGRWVAGMYLAAALATWAAHYLWPYWSQAHVQVFVIDALLLAGLYVVAIRSDRYWPIWITGLHLLTVLSHLQALVAGVFDFRVYFALESVWAPGKLTILLIGVILDRERQRDRSRRRGYRRN